MTKQDILNSLQTFVNQRPGLEPANYAGHADLYRREYREHCHKPKQDFRKLIAAVEWRDSLTADDLRDSFRLAFGGRLEMRRDGSLDYTPGQYGAVEYRRAACAVLARALWDYWAVDAPIGQTPREYIEDTACREFGRGIAARWFN
jgi:hypothetical protein